MGDYRDAIYYPTLDFWTGGNPYDVKSYMERQPVVLSFPLYSPLTLLIHGPLVIPDYSLSAKIYSGLTAAFLLVLAWLAVQWLGRTPSIANVFWFYVLLMLTWSVHINFKFGQSGILLALLTLLSIHYAHKRPWLSGAALALATFKPTFGLPLGVLFLARGHYRSLMWGVALAAMLTVPLVTWLVVQAGGPGAFLGVMASNHQAHEGISSVSIGTSSSRLDGLTICQWWGHHPTGWEQLVFALAILGVASFVLRLTNDQKSEDSAVSPVAAVMVLASTVALYHKTTGWVPIAIPALAILIAAHPRWRQIPRPTRWLTAAIMWVPAWNLAHAYAFRSRVQTFSEASGITLDSAWSTRLRVLWSTADCICLMVALAFCLAFTLAIWRRHRDD